MLEVMEKDVVAPNSLWNRLEQFSLDDVDARQKFSDRLASENGWSKTYTRRVIDEYKRFVYLSQVAGHPVTPSDEVDQVWHLHLCYTRSYWTEMCGEILDRPLHHGPTLGGKDEREKFVDWYDRTLDSYREQFGEQPPAEIWPASRERFSPQRFQRIDTSKHFVIRRGALLALGASIGSVLLLAGCDYFRDSDRYFDVGSLFVTIFLVSLILAILISLAKGGGGKGGGACCGGGSWFGGGGDSDGCGGGGCGGCGGG